MLDEHHFNIGRADNLVFVHELLDHLQSIMDRYPLLVLPPPLHTTRLTESSLCFSVKCIYCGKTFKNHAVLKKHMRKKKHFKVNSKDTAYDKYYMIDYLVPNIYLFIYLFILFSRIKYFFVL